MNAAGKIITLPDEDEMRKRLRALGELPAFGNIWAGFYRLLAPHAGSQKGANEILRIALLMVEECVMQQEPMYQTLFNMGYEGYMHQVIDALIDDEDARDEAKATLQLIMKQEG